MIRPHTVRTPVTRLGDSVKAIATIVLLLASFASQATDTPPLDFAKEYVRELAALQGLREEGEAELKERSTDNTQPFVAGIHSFTRIEIALETNLNILSTMLPQMTPISKISPTFTN
jgi:hypothetical protein